MTSYEKRGYLNSDFKLFHLQDVKHPDIEYHFHDFDKIIIFLQGHVVYRIEGQAYELKPYDIVLVGHNDVHKPEVDASIPYERIIVYLSPGFLSSYKTEEYDLSSCFAKAKELRSSVLRIRHLERSGLFKTITDLEYACCHDGYAKDLYCQVVFLEFMIKLNRAALTGKAEYLSPGNRGQRSLAVMEYIGDHFTEELTIDSVAAACYVSRYHLMHLFKKETGYTIGSYITEKRLLFAHDLLSHGSPALTACYECGFKNYSTFSRAYRAYFGQTPKSAKTDPNENSYFPDGSLSALRAPDGR